MTEVPKLRQRIAGKSIPLEKFVARKARKCESQGGRLLLPALELAYVLHAISRAPRPVVVEHMLPQVEAALAELGRYEGTPEAYRGPGKGSSSGAFWDDWCLARHLQGVCLRYIAYPVRTVPNKNNQSVDLAAAADDALTLTFSVGPRRSRGSGRGRGPPVDSSVGSRGACLRRVPSGVRERAQDRAGSLRGVLCP